MTRHLKMDEADTRRRLEEQCRALGLPAIAALDAVTMALESAPQQPRLGKKRPHIDSW